MILSTGTNLQIAEVRFTEAKGEGEERKEAHLELKLKNGFSNGKPETGFRFADIYGNYADLVRKKFALKVGNELTLTFESRKATRINKDTGKPESKEVWANVQVLEERETAPKSCTANSDDDDTF